MEIKTIKATLEELRRRGLFLGIQRQKYEPYNLTEALEIIKFIGCQWAPKFRIDDENTFAYTNLLRWIHNDPDMQAIDPETKKSIKGRLSAGIYVAGNSGTGKSWALDLASTYALAAGIKIHIGDSTRNLYWRNLRSDDIVNEYTHTGSLERLKRLSILGIQDLGVEPEEANYMGNRINPLKTILEHRGDYTDKLTIISSNIQINHPDLIDRYGDRVASRLLEMCNYFEIKGTDRRKLL